MNKKLKFLAKQLRFLKLYFMFLFPTVFLHDGRDSGAEQQAHAVRQSCRRHRLQHDQAARWRPRGRSASSPAQDHPDQGPHQPVSGHRAEKVNQGDQLDPFFLTAPSTSFSLSSLFQIGRGKS